MANVGAVQGDPDSVTVSTTDPALVTIWTYLAGVAVLSGSLLGAAIDAAGGAKGPRRRSICTASNASP
jgi:hypothetical protein